jgi:hypothetical protein
MKMKPISGRDICIHTHTHTHTHTHMYIYIMEYYLALKKKEIYSFVTTWMHLQDIKEINKIQKDKYYMISLICEN